MKTKRARILDSIINKHKTMSTTKIVLDTASSKLDCFLCSKPIPNEQKMMILGSVDIFWPIHWQCWEDTF